MFDVEETCDHMTTTEYCLRCSGILNIHCIRCGQEFSVPEYEKVCDCADGEEIVARSLFGIVPGLTDTEEFDEC